jgi:hypothetical protein
LTAERDCAKLADEPGVTVRDDGMERADEGDGETSDPFAAAA